MSNSKFHGGPKTSIGKKRSSQNARQHGLFAKEFFFSAEDEIAFDKLNAGLRESLRPDNPLLELLFEDVVACAWRIRMALRNEQRELQKQFAIESVDGREKPQEAGGAFPSPLGARQKEQAIKLLNDIKDCVQRGTGLISEFEEPLTRIFGPELCKTFTQWAPRDYESIWLAKLTDMMAERAKVNGFELPGEKLSAQETKRIGDADAQRQSEMTCKLVDLCKTLTLSAPRHFEGGGVSLDDRGSRLDPAIRYHTTAHRDFYRALREYREAKNSSSSSA
jgi:hypothetical protein